MSDKKDKGHDIDFFRGNLSEDDYTTPKTDGMEDSYTYSDFKFDKKEKPVQPVKQDFNDGYNNEYINEELRRAQMEREMARNNAPQQEVPTDPKIASGERKPLKPQKSNDDFNYEDVPKKKRKDKKRKKRFKGKKIIIGILLFILALLIALFSYLLFIKSTAGPVNFIVIGVDQRKGQADTEIRADALMSVNASTKSNEIVMASIPRDTYTYIPCEEQNDKITHAYVYGAQNWADKGGGVACTVQASAGTLDISVDKYVKLNFDNMVGIIDAIGGIDLKATATFSEQNSKGKKNVYSYVKGKTYHMDGEMALAYSRHRKSDDDIQRGLRQQEVFKAMFAKVKNAKFWQWPGMYTKITGMIDTNLNHKEMLQIAIIYATKGDMKTYKFDWNGAYYGGVAYVELEPTSVKKFTDKVNSLE